MESRPSQSKPESDTSGIKKYMQLLKQAQNPAFVELVAENLTTEVKQRPRFSVKLVDMIFSQFVRNQNDFLRMRVAPVIVKEVLGIYGD